MNKIGIVVLTVCGLSLMGCGVARRAEIRNGGELAAGTATDSDLCSIARADGGKTPTMVREEITRRELGDCSQDYLECKRIGYRVGSESFMNCRMEMVKSAQSDAALQKAAKKAAKRQQTCQSVVIGNVLQTSCN